MRKIEKTFSGYSIVSQAKENEFCQWKFMQIQVQKKAEYDFSNMKHYHNGRKRWNCSSCEC